MEIEPIKAVDIKPFFQSLAIEQLTSRDFLTEFILKRIGISFRAGDFEIPKSEYLPAWQGFRIKSWADELAGFLLFMYEHKDEISSYLEFGTGSGGTFYVVDSYLRTINPDMGYSITIDKKEELPKQFEEYKIANPLANYNYSFTQHFEMSRNYDLCFIDANHSYSSVKRDYHIVKDFCKFIAFHDIFAHNPTKPRKLTARHVWGELTADHKVEIQTIDPRIKFMAGFGIMWND